MNSDRMELADLVHSVSRGLRRSWMADLAPFGISPHQWRALHVIATHDGDPPRQRDVAAMLRIAPRSAAEVIAQLESEGLIVRAEDPMDGRAMLLAATAEGRELERRIWAVRAQRGEEYFSTLDAEDREQLKRLLDSLLEAHPGTGEAWRIPPRRP
ncbi:MULTISPECIES: MarR family winged helix-turn-helix transcriptional regulator [Arthrobacter]|uniref:MarR family winged helix-turn-helix transcriptional regulator n=2 Tax=Arthrobacter TaxID=1663 RepID=A0ABU9KH49_9MICC|nr:MarR family winged helix-turn-helix transcriptional regulator [Arthrobacter sp. YJM1]MDP5226219.1 MarR family winged helix-turn-helix transcriptional regulator [Arthrobacter sp. YJM1]